MQHRLDVGDRNAQHLGQIVALNICLGLFERPGDVVQIGPQRPALAVLRIESEALDQEVLQRACTALHQTPRGAQSAIARLEDHLP